MFFQTALIAALFSSVYALPRALDSRADDPRFTQWAAPGPNDVRSPCPGLNTLANHGFIHRNGKNMTIPHLQAGLKQGLNVGADFTQAIGNVGLLASPNPLQGSFDLDQLSQHNFPIEHDASLSRQDAYFGNDYSFNQQNWNMILQAYSGKSQTDTPTAAKAKYGRVQDSKARNPTFTYGPREFILSYGESALYLQTMGDPSANGVAKLDYVRSMFEKERLPYDLGWRLPINEVNLNTLGRGVFQLYLSSPEPVPEGLIVGINTYKDALELLAAGRNIVGNVTRNVL